MGNIKQDNGGFDGTILTFAESLTSQASQTGDLTNQPMWLIDIQTYGNAKTLTGCFFLLIGDQPTWSKKWDMGKQQIKHRVNQHG